MLLHLAQLICMEDNQTQQLYSKQDVMIQPTFFCLLHITLRSAVSIKHMEFITLFCSNPDVYACIYSTLNVTYRN